MQDPTTPAHAGDPRHPDHERWLLELGRATYAASQVAGICFDLSRVLGGVESADMYSDPLGTLVNRLRRTANSLQISGMSEFIAQLETARDERNDLLHALPVLNGLHRRKTKDQWYVRNFFDVKHLAAASALLTEAARTGNGLLYQDGGEAVRRWYERA
jgi:hypothetical protein